MISTHTLAHTHRADLSLCGTTERHVLAMPHSRSATTIFLHSLPLFGPTLANQMCAPPHAPRPTPCSLSSPFLFFSLCCQCSGRASSRSLRVVAVSLRYFSFSLHVSARMFSLDSSAGSLNRLRRRPRPRRRRQRNFGFSFNFGCVFDFSFGLSFSMSFVLCVRLVALLQCSGKFVA